MLTQPEQGWYQNSNLNCSYLSLALGNDLVLQSVHEVGVVWSGCCLPLRKLFVICSSSRWLYKEVSYNPGSCLLFLWSSALCFPSRRSHDQQKFWSGVRVYSRIHGWRGARRQPAVEDGGHRRAGAADWHEGHWTLPESHFSWRYSVCSSPGKWEEQALVFNGKQMWASAEFSAHRTQWSIEDFSPRGASYRLQRLQLIFLDSA